MSNARTTKGEVTLAAFRLFLERGYQRTTYRDIAELAGVGRNLVQYHFPRKQLLISAFLTTLLDLINSYVHEHRSSESATRGVDLYLIAQIYFAFLLRERIRPLTLDIVSDREISDTVLVLEGQWTSDLEGVNASELDNRIEESIRAASGAYAVLRYHLLRGTVPDVHRLTGRMTVTYLTFVLGWQGEQAENHLVGHDLSPAELAVSGAFLEDALLARS